MAQLTFLGSCREIGRSGFLVEDGSESMLVDYGVKFQDPPAFPDMISTDGLQGIAVTHAHLDHSGGLPRILLRDSDLTLFCTPATRDLSVILLRDMHTKTSCASSASASPPPTRKQFRWVVGLRLPSSMPVTSRVLQWCQSEQTANAFSLLVTSMRLSLS